MSSIGTEIIVRDGLASDIDSVISLTYEMYSELSRDLDVDPSWEQPAREWLIDKLASQEICIAVAEDADGEVVASGVGIIYDDIPQFWLPFGKLGYIRWMSTTSSARGRGIGQRILEHLQNWHLDKDVSRIMIHASGDAYPFYKRNGFHDTIYPNMFWTKPGTPGFVFPE